MKNSASSPCIIGYTPRSRHNIHLNSYQSASYTNDIVHNQRASQLLKPNLMLPLNNRSRNKLHSHHSISLSSALSKSVLNDYNNNNIIPRNYFNITKHKHIESPSCHIFAYSQTKIPDIYQFHSKLINANKQKYIINSSREDIMNHNKLLMDILSSKNNNQHEDKNNMLNVRDKDKHWSILHEQNMKHMFNKKFFLKKTPKDLKKILSKEITSAKTKLGLDRDSHRYNEIQFAKANEVPSIVKHLEKYHYVGKENPLLEINREGKLPSMVDDGAYMQMLLNDGFNNIKHDKLNNIIKNTKNG